MLHATTTSGAAAWRPAYNLRTYDPDGTHASDPWRQVWAVWQALEPAGTGYRLVWVPPIRDLRVRFSKTPVKINEAYDVFFEIPPGTPEGAIITVTNSRGGSIQFTPGKGATSLTWPNQVYSTPGAVDYTVSCTTVGGNTSFPARRQFVNISGNYSLTIPQPQPGGVAFTATFAVTGNSFAAGDTVRFFNDAGFTTTVATTPGASSVSTSITIAAGGEYLWTAEVLRAGVPVAQASTMQQIVPQLVVKFYDGNSTTPVTAIPAGHKYRIEVTAAAGIFVSGTVVTVQYGLAYKATNSPVDVATTSFANVQQWSTSPIPWTVSAVLGSASTSTLANLTISDNRITTFQTTSRSWALSPLSGTAQSAPPIAGTGIKKPVVTLTATNAESAKYLYLLTRDPDDAATRTLKSWTYPNAPETSDTTVTADVEGTWRFYGYVQYHDGTTATTTDANSAIVKVVRVTSTVAADAYTPQVGKPVTITATRTIPAAIPADDVTPLGWFYATAKVGGGAWQQSGVLNNPYTYTAQDDVVYWAWGDRFDDGSTVWSNYIAVDATTIPTHFHVTVQPGQSIQAQIDAAAAWHKTQKTLPVNWDDEQTMACVILAAGNHTITKPLVMRRGVRLVATNATVIVGTGMNGLNIIRTDQNGGGSWNSPDTDWQIIGGLWHAQSGAVTAKGISIAHTKRFRLNGVDLRNVAGGSNYVQMTACGGPYSTSVYDAQIIYCRFGRTTGSKPAGADSDDMAIRLESAWHNPTGTPCGFSVVNDGTQTNNVWIQANEIYNVTRAIGSYMYSNNVLGSHWPDGFHSHILIKSNNIHHVTPVTWGVDVYASEGAIRPFAWYNCLIEDNTFESCYRALALWIGSGAKGGPHGNPGTIRFQKNQIQNQTGKVTAVYGTSYEGTGKYWDKVIFEHNVLSGNWPLGTTDPPSGAGPEDGYFFGVDYTTGTWTNSTYGCLYRYNQFAPSNLSIAQEKAYNKYRADNATNKTGVYIQGNTVSNGDTDNS